MWKRWVAAVAMVAALWAVHLTATVVAMVSTVPCWDFEIDRPHPPVPCPWWSQVGEAVATVLNLPLGALAWGWLIDRVPGLGLAKIVAVNSLIWALAIVGVAVWIRRFRARNIKFRLTAAVAASRLRLCLSEQASPSDPETRTS